MNKVICIHSGACRHKEECGGAKPHELDPNECGHCPRDENAICVPVNGTHQVTIVFSIPVIAASTEFLQSVQKLFPTTPMRILREDHHASTRNIQP